MTSLSSSSTRGIGFRCAVLSGASAEASNSASAANFPGILGQLDRAVKGTPRRTSMASGINNSIDTSAVMHTIHENRRSYQHGPHCDACNTLYSTAPKTCTFARVETRNHGFPESVTCRGLCGHPFDTQPESLCMPAERSLFL